MLKTAKTDTNKADFPLHPDDVRAVRSLALMGRAHIDGNGGGNEIDAREIDFTSVVSSLDQILQYRALVGGIAVSFREYKRLLIVEALRIDARIENDATAETAEARAMGVEISLVSRLRPRPDYQLDSDIPF